LAHRARVLLLTQKKIYYFVINYCETLNEKQRKNIIVIIISGKAFILSYN